MDYVPGGVAALLSGNVTPNRPKSLKRALTPMKHQPSPNVTPKSESVTDRSIFLSPTTQKKKAIVKKSPKRIFQNPDMDVTCENDNNLSITGPKADKVKKHLKDELDVDNEVTKTILSPKSQKNTVNKSSESPSKKKQKMSQKQSLENPASKESSLKKKKRNLSSEYTPGDTTNIKENNNEDVVVSNLLNGNTSAKGIARKAKKSNEFIVETIDDSVIKIEMTESNLEGAKKSKKSKKSKKATGPTFENLEVEDNLSVNKENVIKDEESTNKKRKKKSLKKEPNNVKPSDTDYKLETVKSENPDNTDHVNPNAITNEDTDSEHDSDDDIESDNDENNRAVLDNGREESSDDEEEEAESNEQPVKVNKEVKEHIESEEDVKRTLCVGNVPFSNKCKKEVKRIFDKYGEIQTVRIRTVPVKDARVTPKLAVIKNELHPDRTTVNVYIKYAHPSSVNDALVENNTVLNGNHLRVSRSDVSGCEHDPRLAVFVGNLPFALEDDALRARFESCGQIESVRIVRDRKTNVGKGFGYVNFASKDGVELALALTEEDLTIKNRILRVKRCTQLPTTNRGRSQDKPGRQQGYQGNQQGYQGRQQSFQGRQQSYQVRQQGYQARQQGYQGAQQNFQGRQQGYQGRQQNYQGSQQNQMQGRQFNNRGGQMNRGNNHFSNRFQSRDQSGDSRNDGAYRRLMNKRKPQDNTEGPPQKRPRDFNEPIKQKKPRKEFVGMTAGKKKFQKSKMNKGQKKKKALSEILTKGQ